METRLFCLVVCLQAAFCQKICEWKTCRECIRDPNLCMWCADKDFKEKSRCRQVIDTDKNWCPSTEIQNPLSDITVSKSNNFSSEVGRMVQIKPQRYHLDLRVGQEQEFTFSYKASENFPVDIYFLLDASLSMKHMKDDLLYHANNIFQTISNLTEDVNMGLGTFIDKNLVPFSNNVKANGSYSFKHQLELNSNISRFNEILANLKFGTNSDDPEAGLEGIAQAVACKNTTKWREQSRKILVLMTDQAYHSAGDGKAAGIIRPYDGGCYLDENNFYSKEKEMDYPSVGIINKMVREEEIKTLFVSNYPHQTVYSTLARAIHESESVNYGSNAIVAKLKTTYEKISTEIKLKVNLTDTQKRNIDISFKPNCDIDHCKVSVGEEINFSGKLLLKKYFGENRLYIGVNPTGLKEEIVLDINVISACDCSINAEITSKRCHNIGNWSCGVCECPIANYGPTCDCSGNSSQCSPPDSEQVCNDRGVCNHCGHCECAEGYVGEYCQSQNNNCPRDSNNTLCSGRGTCLDGKCTCIVGWTAAACDCTTSNATCIKEGVECSNLGHCECGSCVCDAPEKWDVRNYDNLKFCTQGPCPDCHNNQCKRLIPCVLSLHEGNTCAYAAGNTLMVQKPEFARDDKVKWENCSHIKINFECFSNFKYFYNDNNTMTLVVLNTDCAQSQMLIGIISVVVLVGIGLVTLLAWKLMTDARDRREYEAFLKSAQESDSIRQNPTYTAPSTTYVNPGFQSFQNSLNRKD